MKTSVTTRSATVLALLACLMCLLAQGGEEAKKAPRKRMRPDDPPGTKVFQETLPDALSADVQRLVEKYGGTNAPDPEIQGWIEKLASYELVEDPDFKRSDTVNEEVLARRRLRNMGLRALGPLIRATARANPMIRPNARSLIADIAMANDLEMELLPVFLRASYVVGDRVSLIGGVGRMCESLGRKKRYEDCEVCLKHIAELTREKDDEVVFEAVLKLHQFGRLDLVPAEVLAKPQIKTGLDDWIEKSKTSFFHTPSPLPKPKQTNSPPSPVPGPPTP